MRIQLKSHAACAEIDTHGAELKSFIKDGVEYMWQADPAYWARTAPVLFPFVGQVAGGVYRYEGKEFKMGQHGFARDMEFALVDHHQIPEEGSDFASFRLISNDESFARYPLNFVLDIAYKLVGSRLYINWRVFNPASKPLYFSIGAHPAFNCKLSDCQLRVYSDDKPLCDFDNHLFGPGLMTGTHEMVHFDNGTICMDEHTFDGDAFVLENHQADKVELWTNNGKKLVTMGFDTPLVGLWSPPKKNAPFVCIEPWFGRADKVGFAGDLSEREFGNTLKAGESFETTYYIEIG